VLCALALCGFAGNSLLTRLALRPHLIDAASFTALRLCAGAAALLALAQLRKPRAGLGQGSWLSALLLFVYAAPFTYAYLRMGAAIGALILFGVVQVTMISWGLFRGERPRAGEWLGLSLALSGLVALTLPGAKQPDLVAVLLMTVAGIAWGAYSLRGRGSRDPLAATAGNFTRAAPFSLLLAASAWLPNARVAHAAPSGVLLALSSGALTSGVAYTLWYAALPNLSALRAALVQLAVPVLAAAAAVVLLDEPLTLRLIGAGLLVLFGVSCALWTRRPAPPPKHHEVAPDS
jgi:drug/metabolite transporter (DMT)-like permease